MLSPGTLLQQRYEVIAKIGQGGMGAIYEAIDQRLGHRVALKQTLVHEPQLARAFEREARLLASLRHPALPKVSDHWQDEQGQFLVMEYIPGDDLAALVQQRTSPLPVDAVLRWAHALLDALSYLHTHEPPIIHRDIKPHNIKITPRNEPILLDFGLAKGLVDMTVQTTASIYAYTLQFAPLEQIHGQPTDQRSDLYSLAATIYFLLSGTPPPNAVARAAALAAGQQDPLQPLAMLRRDVPTHVDAVLRQALALQPNQRLASATEFQRALAGATPAQPQTALPTEIHAPQLISTPAPAVTLAPAARKRFWPAMVLGVLTLVAVCSGLGFLAARSLPMLAQAPTALSTTAPVGSFVLQTEQPSTPATQTLAPTQGAQLADSAPTNTPPNVPTESVSPQPVQVLPPDSVIASSTAPDGQDSAGNLVSYAATNVADNRADTAWRVPGDGSNIVLTLNYTAPVRVYSVAILPGYAKVDTSTGVNRFIENRRVALVRLEFGDGSSFTARLKDRLDIQPITLPLPAETTFVRVVILGTTDHGGRDFTAISEVQVQGQPGIETGVAALPQATFVSAPTAVAPLPTTERSAPAYVFPVRSDGKVSFGSTHHDYPATDIFCPQGSQFLAPTAGVVDFVSREDRWDMSTDDPAERGGLSVAIIGDDGVRYYGSHLSAVQDGIRPGVRVEVGQVLGLTGKSGNARNTDAHLHFGISHPTTPDDWQTRRGEVEPEPYLKAWQRGEQRTPQL